MSEDNSEVFPVEFRHGTVIRIVRGIIDGSIVLNPKPETLRSDKSSENVANAWVDMAMGTQQYCSGKYQGTELAEIEAGLFRNFTILRIYGSITERYTPTKVEQDIAKLNARMDSTNNLLIEVLKVLKSIAEVFDNLGKSS